MYSGWYNGLAKKHYINIARSKETEHEVIVFCKANPQVKIIEAIDIILKKVARRTRHCYSEVMIYFESCAFGLPALVRRFLFKV